MRGLKLVKSVPMWIWTVIVGLGTIIGIISGIVAVWNQIESNTNASIETATILITAEIHKQTSTIAEFLEDDLYERIIILEVDIEALEEKGLPVPVQKKIQLKSMRERLEEFKKR